MESLSFVQCRLYMLLFCYMLYFVCKSQFLKHSQAASGLKIKWPQIKNCWKPREDTYICQEARKKCSASSDQNWRVAEGCNVTMIISSKYKLKVIIIESNYWLCQIYETTNNSYMFSTKSTAKPVHQVISCSVQTKLIVTKPHFTATS